MGADRALFFLHELVWRALLIGSPILLGTLIVGLLISVLQVATQIQEITLSYVPVWALRKTPSPARPCADEPKSPAAPKLVRDPCAKPAPSPVKIATISGPRRVQRSRGRTKPASHPAPSLVGGTRKKFSAAAKILFQPAEIQFVGESIAPISRKWT